MVKTPVISLFEMSTESLCADEISFRLQQLMSLLQDFRFFSGSLVERKAKNKPTSSSGISGLDAHLLLIITRKPIVIITRLQMYRNRNINAEESCIALENLLPGI